MLRVSTSGWWPDMNSYNVSFALDWMVITTTVFAMNEEVAVPMARDQLAQDYPEVVPLLEQAFDLSVELLDTDVLPGV